MNIYPFHGKVPFLYPLKNSEKPWRFQGKKGNIGVDWSTSIKHSEASMKQIDDSPKSSKLFYTHKISTKVTSEFPFFPIINSVSIFSLIHQRSASSQESHWDQDLVCIFDKIFLVPIKKKEKIYCQFHLINGSSVSYIVT